VLSTAIFLHLFSSAQFFLCKSHQWLLLFWVYREDAERLATNLRKLRLIDLLERVEVGEIPFTVQNGRPSKTFKIRLKFYPPQRYPPHLNLTLSEIEDVVRDQFIPRLMKTIKKSFQSRSGKRKEDIIQVLQSSQTGESSRAETGNLVRLLPYEYHTNHYVLLSHVVVFDVHGKNSDCF
jgi:hypothetical protein